VLYTYLPQEQLYLIFHHFIFHVNTETQPKMQVSWGVKLFFGAGAFWTSILLSRVLRWIWIYARPSSIGRYLHQTDGKPAWALVTGASDGIGRALSRESARRGFNVLLHGRNPAKLEAVVADLRKQFPERTFRTLIANAMAEESEMKREIEGLVEEVKDLNLTVLINNVGGMPSSVKTRFASFDKSTWSDTADNIALNAIFPAQLTRALLPRLIVNQPSLIMALGSMADYGQPYLAIYGGTKAFIMAWCRGLARELAVEKLDIEVLGIVTAEVTAVSHNFRKANIIMPSSWTYAKHVFDRVGCGRVVINGYWSHGILRSVLDRLPDSVVGFILMGGMKVQKEEDAKRR